MGPLSDLPASEHTSFCFSTQPSLPRCPWPRRSERALRCRPVLTRAARAAPRSPQEASPWRHPQAARPSPAPGGGLSLRALAASLRSLRSWAACGAGAPPPARALSCQFPSDSRTQAWLSFLPLRASHRNQQISKNSEVKSKEARGGRCLPGRHLRKGPVGGTGLGAPAREAGRTV